jgi:integrase
VPKILLHDTRHTMATLALEAGAHPELVQEQLGHSAIAVTLDTYSQSRKPFDETVPTRSPACTALAGQIPSPGRS